METKREKRVQFEELVEEDAPIIPRSGRKNNKKIVISAIIIAAILVAGVITTILLVRKSRSLTNSSNTSSNSTVNGITVLPVYTNVYKIKNPDGKYIFWNGSSYILDDVNFSRFTVTNGNLASTNVKERAYYISLAEGYVSATGQKTFGVTESSTDFSRWFVTQNDVLNHFNIRSYAFNNYIATTTSSSIQLVLAGNGPTLNPPPANSTWLFVPA